jgi:CRP-like cAMP-binding protein/predicted GNAT family N-acyltransferase
MDHEKRVLLDDADRNALTIAAFEGEDAVGTIRLTPFHALSRDDVDRVALEELAVPVDQNRQLVIGRLMVRATHRGTAVSSALFATAYRLAIERGYEFGYLECSPKHVPLYESVGWRPVGPAFAHDGFGLCVPMAMLVRDTEYFARVNSPFAALASGVSSCTRLAAWFAASHGARAYARSVKLMDQREQTSLRATLASLPLTLFEGICSETITRLTRTSAVISVAAGKALLPRGSRGSELFLVLRGRVLLSTQHTADTRIPVDPGDFFAENGCLRMSAVPFAWHASTESQTDLLSISAETFHALEAICPESTSLMVERLLESNRRRLAGQFPSARVTRVPAVPA